MTQKQISQILNMSQTGYSKYETGENDIPTHILIELSKLYKTSVDYILGLTDDPLLKANKNRGYFIFQPLLLL